MKGSTVISTGSAWFEELQTLRALHLAPTPGHCSHTLHPASKYVLHCQMEMRAEFWMEAFPADFPLYITSKNHRQRFYITTLLKPNCKRSGVSTYLFKHLLLFKQLYSGHTSISQGLCNLSPGSSLQGNKHLNKPSYLPRRQHAHQALFWTFENLTYKLAGR